MKQLLPLTLPNAQKKRHRHQVQDLKIAVKHQIVCIFSKLSTLNEFNFSDPSTESRSPSPEDSDRTLVEPGDSLSEVKPQAVDAASSEDSSDLELEGLEDDQVQYSTCKDRPQRRNSE